FDMPLVWAQTAALMSALPTGTGPFMLARLYGRDAALGSRVILVSTVCSVARISLLVGRLRSCRVGPAYAGQPAQHRTRRRCSAMGRSRSSSSNDICLPLIFTWPSEYEIRVTSLSLSSTTYPVDKAICLNRPKLRRAAPAAASGVGGS